MAKDKASFILYSDWIHIIEKLPDEKAGQLIKIIFQYVNDKDPVVEDLLLQVAFEPMKLQLKRDLKNWEAERSRLSESGKKGGIKSGISRRNKAQRSSASKNEANEAVNVTVTVNDTVNERENTDTQGSEIKFPIERCLQIAMMDPKWKKENKPTEVEISEFMTMLTGTGEHEKNPADFKRHFYHWKKKGKINNTGPAEAKLSVQDLIEQENARKLRELHAQ